RGDALPLQFTNNETHDLLINHIIPSTIKGKTKWKILEGEVPEITDDNGHFLSYDTNSPEFKKFTDNLNEVQDLLHTHMKEIPEGELNGRTIQRLYGVYHHAKQVNDEIKAGERPGEKPRDLEKELVASMRGTLSK